MAANDILPARTDSANSSPILKPAPHPTFTAPNPLRHPSPIDASHKPTVSIARLPADAPIDQILSTIERDGGIILKNFATSEELDAINADVEAYRGVTRSTEKSALHIIPKETLAVPGLVGKSPAIAAICSENPVLEKLREEILTERFSVIREDVVEENTIDPLLSISITFKVQSSLFPFTLGIPC